MGTFEKSWNQSGSITDHMAFSHSRSIQRSPIPRDRKRTRSPSSFRDRDPRSRSPSSSYGTSNNYRRRSRSRESSRGGRAEYDDWRMRTRPPTAPRYLRMLDSWRPKPKNFMEQCEARAAKLAKETAERTRKVKSCTLSRFMMSDAC